MPKDILMMNDKKTKKKNKKIKAAEGNNTLTDGLELSLQYKRQTNAGDALLDGPQGKQTIVSREAHAILSRMSFLSFSSCFPTTRPTSSLSLYTIKVGTDFTATCAWR